MARKKVPPSKIKYDKAHPTVSVRVSREFREELRELQRIGGKTLGDILREALGKQMPDAKRAYNKGYEDAKKEYAVTFLCKKCFKEIYIIGEEAKRAAASYMMNGKWTHADCRVVDPFNLSGYR